VPLALLNRLLLLHYRVSKKQVKAGRKGVGLRTYKISQEDLRVLKRGLEAIPVHGRVQSDERLLHNVTIRLQAIERGEDLRVALLRERRSRVRRKGVRRWTMEGGGGEEGLQEDFPLD